MKIITIIGVQWFPEFEEIDYIFQRGHHQDYRENELE
jgi:hypothetical protein